MFPVNLLLNAPNLCTSTITQRQLEEETNLLNEENNEMKEPPNRSSEDPKCRPLMPLKVTKFIHNVLQGSACVLKGQLELFSVGRGSVSRPFNVANDSWYGEGVRQWQLTVSNPALEPLSDEDDSNHDLFHQWHMPYLAVTWVFTLIRGSSSECGCSLLCFFWCYQRRGLHFSVPLSLLFLHPPLTG